MSTTKTVRSGSLGPGETRYDFGISNLEIRRGLTVGRTTFRPKGWAARNLGRAVAQQQRPQSWGPRDIDWLLRWPWATAHIATNEPHSDDLVGALRDDVRDSVAVLRLYQRLVVPNWSMESQTFGLDIDVDSPQFRYWRSDNTGLRGFGWHREGIDASWTFTNEQLEAFHANPRMRELDAALRGKASGPLVVRALSALAVLNQATAMHRDSVRIVLQATSLETMLGDDKASAGSGNSKAHPVSRRAAFVTCPADGAHLAAGDSPCACLTTLSATQLAKDPRMSRRPDVYFAWPCTEYWGVREIFALRNDAVHDARQEFPRRTPLRFEGRIDDIVLALVDWAIARPGADLADLDAAIASL